MEVNGKADDEKIMDFKDLDSAVQELIKKAVEARKFAYCPYSSFAVGAALKTTTGEIFTGCNVENGAHSPTVCAERTALCKAVSEGFQSFSKVAVVAFQENYFTAPCGACRQSLSEFAPSDITVYMSTPEPTRILVTSVHKLLPHRFRPEELKIQS